MSLSDPRPNPATSTYNFTASSITTGGPGAIQCIEEVFSSTSNVTSAGATLPTSLDTTGATINAGSTDWATGVSGWTPDVTTNGRLILHSTTPATPSSGGPHGVAFDNITNSSIANTGIYVGFTTYAGDEASGNCSGAVVDSVTVQYVQTAGSTLSLNVDGALTFTVAGVAHGASCGTTGLTTTGTAANDSTATTIPLGTVTTAQNTIGCQTLTAGTNATNGFTIYVRDLAQLKNALNQNYADWTGTNGSPTTFPAAGTAEAYGYTTDDTTLSTGPGAADRFTNSGPNFAGFGHSTDGTGNAEVAYETAPTSSSSGIYHVGVEASMLSTTKPGAYQTTVVYTCTPVY